MKKIRFERNSDGYAELISSPEALSLVESYAESMASKTGGTYQKGGEAGESDFRYKSEISGKSRRAVAVVATSSYNGRRLEAYEKALTKARVSF